MCCLRLLRRLLCRLRLLCLLHLLLLDGTNNTGRHTSRRHTFWRDGVHLSVSLRLWSWRGGKRRYSLRGGDLHSKACVRLLGSLLNLLLLVMLLLLKHELLRLHVGLSLCLLGSQLLAAVLLCRRLLRLVLGGQQLLDLHRLLLLELLLLHLHLLCGVGRRLRRRRRRGLGLLCRRGSRRHCGRG